MKEKKTLLIVDDNSHEAFSIGSVLQAPSREKGFSLRVFTDGDEALRYISSDAEFPIGGAIIDLWMVDKRTGLEDPTKGEAVINAIHTKHPKAKVVVLSAHMDDKARESFSRKQMQSFKKPASVMEVFEAISGGE